MIKFKIKCVFGSLELVKALNHTLQGHMPSQINSFSNEIPIKAFVFSSTLKIQIKI